MAGSLRSGAHVIACNAACCRVLEACCRGALPACSELHFCNGLAFTFVRKLGVGLSFEAGHGFVIRKIYTGEALSSRNATFSMIFTPLAAAGAQGPPACRCARCAGQA